VREAAGFVGVDVTLIERSPLELSGGQKRRVAIAGIIAMRPGVLILDEPTAGLDPAGCNQILSNIMEYKNKTGSTVIIISHNMDDVARLAERILVFNHGEIVMDGTPEQIFDKPEELIEIGLSVPHATELAMELRARGVDLPGAIYTHEQLKAAILAAKGASVC
ncbi:MAG: ATP-binding cassette domain-containing protein, partial [Oscillospiraceae bacterium]|nr:ATP-binding cassette domain-containing protein [Oscillospiraceae bacterium]